MPLTKDECERCQDFLDFALYRRGWDCICVLNPGRYFVSVCFYKASDLCKVAYKKELDWYAFGELIGFIYSESLSEEILKDKAKSLALFIDLLENKSYQSTPEEEEEE